MLRGIGTLRWLARACRFPFGGFVLGYRVKVTGFVYARSDSVRFPGKCFARICGVPLLELVLRRSELSGLDAVCVLTSDLQKDDALSDFSESLGFTVFRGHPTDLVQRTLGALEALPSDYFLRINGDSPWFCSELARFARFQIPQAEFVTNLVNRSFPYGVAVELVSTSVYQTLAPTAFDDEREHVTLHLYRQLDRIVVANIVQVRDDSALRLTVDYPADASTQADLFSHCRSLTSDYWEAVRLPPPQFFLRTSFRA